MSMDDLTSRFITLQEYTQLLWAHKCNKYSVVWPTQSLKSCRPARKIYPVAMETSRRELRPNFLACVDKASLDP